MPRDRIVTSNVVSGLADTASEWKGERLAVFHQALDENVVGKVHGEVVGLWRCRACSVFEELEGNLPRSF